MIVNADQMQVFETTKKRQDDDKCRCECKELIDKGICGEEFLWNPSNCESECDKSCDVGKYLDYKNCKYRKILVDKLVEECTENIDEVKIASENEHKCSSCMLDFVLFSIILTMNVGIVSYFPANIRLLEDVFKTS